MAIDNAYAELGLPPGASEAEIKRAWRRLVSQWHPDRNPSAGAVANLQRINRAFQLLRQAGVVQEPVGEKSQRTDPATADDSSSADAAEPLRTISRRLKLTLEQAATGCTLTLRGKYVQRCTGCAGAGFHVRKTACAGCAGSGTVRQRSWFGWFGAVEVCAACAGSGKARDTCADCGGSGKLPPRSYRVGVRIPHGVRDGDTLHVDGRRVRALDGGSPVNLDLRVELRPHELFALESDGTIRCRMPVDGFSWIANREVEVPTLAGSEPLRLNRERTSYRLPGRGFPAQRRGAPADLLLTIVPRFPSRFSSDQQILIDQLIATTVGAGGVSVDREIGAWQQAVRRNDERRAATDD